MRRLVALDGVALAVVGTVEAHAPFWIVGQARDDRAVAGSAQIAAELPLTVALIVGDAVGLHTWPGSVARLPPYAGAAPPLGYLGRRLAVPRRQHPADGLAAPL